MSRLICGECLNNFAKTGEREVDALALSESMPRVGADACFAVPLTAGQVNQVQLGFPEVLVTKRVGIDHLQVQGEDGMGAG